MLAAAALWLALPGAAGAAERVALVIGNDKYENATPLKNPGNDARAVGAALARLGFEVTRLEDAGYDALRLSLQKFEKAAARSEIAAVFYAGHGMEMNKHNYLIPVDATLTSDRDVKHEAMELDRVMESVEGASELRLVILDACRNNPFAEKMRRGGATRSIGRGLARVEPPGNASEQMTALQMVQKLEKEVTDLLIVIGGAPGRRVKERPIGEDSRSPMDKVLGDMGISTEEDL